MGRGGEHERVRWVEEVNSSHASFVGEGGAATPIPKEFKLLHLYWQASNYLSVGQASISIRD
jgi:hypothetical protein